MPTKGLCGFMSRAKSKWWMTGSLIVSVRTRPTLPVLPLAMWNGNLNLCIRLAKIAPLVFDIDRVPPFRDCSTHRTGRPRRNEPMRARDRPLLLAQRAISLVAIKITIRIVRTIVFCNGDIHSRLPTAILNSSWSLLLSSSASLIELLVFNSKTAMGNYRAFWSASTLKNYPCRNCKYNSCRQYTASKRTLYG